ncbi:DUF2690 domain-containing protein [Paeniglutamicibacter antarcticus]|uniref:DUF2690 domain-containing protein n=1 Tax=Paeniglutamicibacter antarcticus TaxID=494023 RepID=A0ABP9TKM9_9MICC
MTSFRRRIGAILATTLIAVGVTLGASMPAQANPIYRGGDPLSTGCSNGAYTLTSWGLYNSKYGQYQGSVELRYSPKCGTNWIRVTSNTPGNQVSGQILTNYGAYGSYRQGSGATFNNPGTLWSAMVEAPGNACVYVSATIKDIRTGQVEGRLSTQTVC